MTRLYRICTAALRSAAQSDCSIASGLVNTHLARWVCIAGRSCLEQVEKVTQAVTEAANELGFPVLKPEQLEVVTSFLRGRDVFAVLPTGFGKSLCYACLPAAFDKILEKEKGHSIVVVVTPLLAIIHDQVCKAR